MIMTPRSSQWFLKPPYESSKLFYESRILSVTSQSYLWHPNSLHNSLIIFMTPQFSLWCPKLSMSPQSSLWLPNPLYDLPILSTMPQFSLCCLKPLSLWLPNPLCNFPILSVTSQSSLWCPKPLYDSPILSVIRYFDEVHVAYIMIYCPGILFQWASYTFHRLPLPLSPITEVNLIHFSFSHYLCDLALKANSCSASSIFN